MYEDEQKKLLLNLATITRDRFLHFMSNQIYASRNRADCDFWIYGFTRNWWLESGWLSSLKSVDSE